MHMATDVLVADDNDTDRMLLSAIVKAEGYNVVTASNGEEAIRVFKERRPQLVLLDALMPVLDGFQVARQIKSLAGETFVPVIFLTAITAADELAKCVDSGGDDFLSKPYNKVILQAKLSALERQRQLHDTMLQQRDQIARHNAYLLHEQSAAKAVFDRVAHTGTLDCPNIKHLISPLAVFNGDVLLAARNPGGSLYVFMGDFTGHGLTAAIGAMPLADVFYGMTRKGFLLEEVIRECNRKLHTVLPPGQFCCATMVDINYHKHSMECWSGGLPAGYVIRASEREFEPVVSQHLPLGILSPDKFRSQTKRFELKPDDRLLLYTDGLLESRDASGTVYSEEQLEAALLETPALDDIFDAIQREAYAQIGAKARDDDVTLLEVRMLEDDALLDAPTYARSRSAGPQDWRFTYELGAESLKIFNPLPLLQHILMSVPELSFHGGSIYVVLAETFSNALEHGVLGLDSSKKSSVAGFGEYYAERSRALEELSDGFVRFEFRCFGDVTGGSLSIKVIDSGPGFDYTQHENGMNDSAYHGRGLPLLRSLCKSLEYQGCGNEVEVIFEWVVR